MKKFDDSLLIEYKTERLSDKYRYVYYRIKPEQLNWWDRIFNNRWEYMWGAAWDGDKMVTFNLKQFHEFSGFKTFGEVRKYLEEQAVRCVSNRQEVIEARKKMAENGKIWPDEIYNF